MDIKSMYLSGPQNRFESPHSTLRHCTMLLLFLHCPCCSFASQTEPISTHESPRSVDEASEHFNQTCI